MHRKQNTFIAILAYNNRRNAYSKQGKRRLAEKDYNKAIQLNYKFAKAYFNRGKLYSSWNKFPQGERDLDMAINLGYKRPDAYIIRGRLRHFQRKAE